MKLSTSIKPISYLKAHASEIVRDLGRSGPAMVITQNGEAKAVLQDIHSYEQTQETLALLKILALGQQQIAEGKVVPLDEAIDRIKASRRGSK
ncbi:type II toxin-antitoxin system Phd/YefM family antitoxin [Solimonas sp. K1W22B-7]|uniref:type II toxin-antitoxin system Phd/YefM family antitoxin n=1 Tax=Solimonas sp. K1W22B-7 TaxID=2303331 RepID=UPI000E337CC8|nr:type II toxin-antitoxin system Phd/YefM family antitoxin [Solimonas sp. K1W22B-7]AXQ27174.1 type II toxin-antitoxin system Phd/YefM family antitoxin [Solimonas sp. K1W22B-7]